MALLAMGSADVLAQQRTPPASPLERTPAADPLRPDARPSPFESPLQEAPREGGLDATYNPGSRGALSDAEALALDDPGAAAAAASELSEDGPLTTETDRAARQARRQQPDEDLQTGTIRLESIDALDDERNARAARDNQRAGAIEDLPRRPEENPYAPLGMRLGTFVFTPRLEQGIGWTSNGSASPRGSDAAFSETALRLGAVSDWSRHQASFQADGVYRRSLSGEEIKEIEGSISGDLRLDLADQWQALASLGYRVRPESASSPDFVEGAIDRPLRHTFTGSAGLSREIGRVKLGVRGSMQRETFEDAEFGDGSVLSQADRDYTLATMALRTGYEISPALTPFVEAEIGRRKYDEEFDRDGYARSADRYALRGGIELDLGEKTRGEVSLGWIEERPDDARLTSISGLEAASNLEWSPVRGTVVALTGSTTVEGSTTAGASGSLLYSGSLALRRELRSNLTGTALAGVDWRDYANSSEHDLILRGELSLTWWLNRYAGITGRTRHEVQRSSIADRDYDATSVFLGMTLQR